MAVSNGTIRIILADDHQLVREGLAGQLRGVADFDVIGEADNADAALKTALELKPDVLLLDIDMPGISAFHAAQHLHRECPQTRVIVVSAYLTDEYLNDAVMVGAMGYVLKSAPFDELVTAIREAMASRPHYSNDVKERMAEAPNGGQRPNWPVKTKLSILTPRERELLKLLAAGVSLKEAARQLNVSYKTADNQRTRLMKKLEIHDRVELSRFAIREGIIQP